MRQACGKKSWEILPELFSGAVLGWFAGAKRDLPWRRTGDPYAIWVSETMLQQTQVETVKSFYERFLRRFPTVGDLAGAELSEVLRVWAGLGYYRRAKFLHAAARVVVERYGGRVPGEVAQLLELPGVGRYTAGAVASIAYGVAAAAVDGNVMRVLARVGGVEGDLRSAQVQKGLWVMAEGLVPKKRAGDFNQGLMELGATVCRVRDPECGGCPVRGWCRAYLEQKTTIIPWKSPGKDKISLKMDVFLLNCGGFWLILRRPGGGLWGHLWEFPVLETGQFGAIKDKEAVIWRELGVEVLLEAWVGRVEHTLTHRRMEYRVYRGVVAGEKPEAGRQEPEGIGGREAVRPPQVPPQGSAKGASKGTTPPARGAMLGGVCGVKLPRCAGGGERYEEAAWVKMGELGKMYAVGRVTEKIARKAEG